MDKSHEIQVKVYTVNNLHFIGKLTIKNGYHSRLSDLLNDDRSFLPLTDVELFDGDTILEKSPFLCINKQSILFLAEN